MLAKLRTTLAGRKTYLVAVAAILTALAAWSEDQIGTFELIQTAFGSVIAMTVRSGIKRDTGATAEIHTAVRSIPGPADRGGPGNRGVFIRGQSNPTETP